MAGKFLSIFVSFENITVDCRMVWRFSWISVDKEE